jgi:hypothetical protein
MCCLFSTGMTAHESPQSEASPGGRAEGSVRAQTFLDMLRGAFQLTWGRLEAIPQTVVELSSTEEAKTGLRALLSYLEALSPCLVMLCGGVGEQEGEAAPARQTRGRRRRRRRGGCAGSCANIGEVSQVGQGHHHEPFCVWNM